MTSLAQVATALQFVLTEVAATAAREVRFFRRVREWTGALFVQTLVWGWLGNPTASLGDLTQVAAKLGVAVSPQSLARRFTEEAATLLERVLRGRCAWPIWGFGAWRSSAASPRRGAVGCRG